MAVVRLGDADRLGWWRSHSADDVAEFVLGEAFPNTWLATGLELAMESARVRHDTVLERRTAVHLLSDHLPYHQLLRSWLIEKKLERDMVPLGWTRSAELVQLRNRLPSPQRGERRAQGLYLGTVSATELADPGRQDELLAQLAGGYAELDEEFVAPYVDLAG